MATEVLLFNPTKGGMVDAYPELKSIPGIEDLTTDEIRLCWFVSSPSTPLYKMKGANRVKEAIKIVFNGRDVSYNKRIQSLVSGEPDNATRNCMTFFAANEIGYRLRSYFVQVKIFEAFEKMVDIDTDSMEGLSPDMAAAYVQNAIRISEAMPKIISRIESSGLLFLETKRKENSAITLDTLEEDEE